MHKIIAVALLTASLAAFPAALPSFAAQAANDGLCGPDGPEAYKRPGGYCEQVDNKGSLVEPTEGDCEWLKKLASTETFEAGEPILVAANCYIYIYKV